jgi:hypothetical protein
MVLLSEPDNISFVGWVERIAKLGNAAKAGFRCSLNPGLYLFFFSQWQ